MFLAGRDRLLAVDKAEQTDMFPDDVPEPVIRYWQAAARWYASGTHAEPTREEFVKKFLPREISTRTLDRIRRRYASLVGAWPPKRSDRPPWERPNLLPAVPDDPLNGTPNDIRTLRRVRTAGFDEDGNPVTITQLYDSKTGDLIHSFITNLHGLVAAISTMTMIEAMHHCWLDGPEERLSVARTLAAIFLVAVSLAVLVDVFDFDGDGIVDLQDVADAIMNSPNVPTPLGLSLPVVVVET